MKFYWNFSFFEGLVAFPVPLFRDLSPIKGRGAAMRITVINLCNAILYIVQAPLILHNY